VKDFCAISLRDGSSDSDVFSFGPLEKRFIELQNSYASFLLLNISKESRKQPRQRQQQQQQQQQQQHNITTTTTTNNNNNNNNLPSHKVSISLRAIAGSLKDGRCRTSELEEANVTRSFLETPDPTPTT
jgi:hypothetical protein